MNFLFISPNFPEIYWKFVKELKDDGATVLAIGDTPYFGTKQELRDNVQEYYYLPNLANYDDMCKAVQYFFDKYGKIDFLESNNEFWLMQDAELRKKFCIDTGFYPENMEKIKYKSKMKEYFIKAGAKVARYILVDTLENCQKFAAEVGYPLFVKPDNGVGASHSYKISNEEELIHFINTKDNEIYIMEEYIDGELMSFDGVCDIDGNVVVCFNEHFPNPIAEVVNTKSDLYYYAMCDMPEDFKELGKRVVKSFGISKRCFHIEFFKLNKAKKGLGKKGDYIALETNMRSPGGNTPDLLCLALNESYYKVYADTICFNESKVDLNKEKFVAISVARRDGKPYKNSPESINNLFGQYIKEVGRYDPAIAEAMGNDFYFATFKTLEEAIKFKDYVLELNA